MTAQSIWERPHFTSSCWPFTCSECLEEFPPDSLMMPIALPLGVPYVQRQEKKLCETCGKKLLESL